MQAGANLEQLQRSSGARLQLSRAGEFYPGTSERVLLLSGSLHSVLTAVYLILEKIAADSKAGMRGKSATMRKPDELVRVSEVLKPPTHRPAPPTPA